MYILRWKPFDIHEQYGVTVTFEDDDVKILLSRAVGELLINVTKHAQVHNAKVSIGRAASHIRICVRDEGVWFDVLEKNS